VLASVLSTVAREPAISVREWPDPSVPAGWVLVRVVCAALNRNDAMTVDERLELSADAVIGSDASGIVVATGEGVDDVSVGDPVVVHPSLWWGDRDDVQSPGYQILGYPLQGTHAELVAVPVENVVAKPDRLTWEQAAALPLAGMTAWRAVRTRGGAAAGETVIVTAGSSGVGTLAIQIARSLGARVVAVTSTPTKATQLRQLGAHAVVLRGARDLEQELLTATDGGADLVVDSAGADWAALAGALRPGGRLVSVGRMAANVASLPVRTVFWNQLSILGSSMGSPRDVTALMQHIDSSDWTPVVDSVFPLTDITSAYERLDHPDRFGKVVLAATEP
jgi:zinc-binding alcohol dehydrogenase/oxidoreductase